MLTTIVFFIHLFWLSVLLFCIGIGVTIYLVKFKTLTKEMCTKAMSTDMDNE